MNSWQPEREVLRECLDEYESVSEGNKKNQSLVFQRITTNTRIFSVDDIRPLLRGELTGSHEAKCVVSCLLHKLDGVSS